MKKIQKAVALKYPSGAAAPFISVKCRGREAERVLEIAKEKKIPVVRDSALTDVLFLEDAGALIPPETYFVVAEVFALIQKCEESSHVN